MMNLMYPKTTLFSVRNVDGDKASTEVRLITRIKCFREVVLKSFTEAKISHAPRGEETRRSCLADNRSSASKSTTKSALGSSSTMVSRIAPFDCTCEPISLPWPMRIQIQNQHHLIAIEARVARLQSFGMLRISGIVTVGTRGTGPPGPRALTTISRGTAAVNVVAAEADDLGTTKLDLLGEAMFTKANGSHKNPAPGNRKSGVRRRDYLQQISNKGKFRHN